MVANTNTAVRTVTPIVQNKTPLQKSKKGYDPDRTEAFIRDVEKRARATGLLPWSFNLVGRLRTRKLIKLKLIEPSGTMNTKGATAFQQNVKKLYESFKAGTIWNEAVPMVIKMGSRYIIVIGDHRFEAFKQLGWTEAVFDVIELDINDEVQKMAYDLISPNSNNFTPRESMTFRAHAAHIYRMINTPPGNTKSLLYDVFNPQNPYYTKKRAYTMIRSFKSPCSSAQCKKILRLVQDKMSEADTSGTAFKTLTGTTTGTALEDVGLDNRADVEYVSHDFIDRYIWDKTAELAGTDNKAYIIVRVNTSDFTISEDKLNDTRAKMLFDLDLKSSLASEQVKWSKTGVLEKHANNVQVIGCLAQHSKEHTTKLVRISDFIAYTNNTMDYKVSYASAEEAIALGTMCPYVDK